MDPDEVLRRIRCCAGTIKENEEDATSHSEDEIEEAAQDMAAKFTALDEWLSRGGFYPKAWRTHFPTVKTEARARAFLKATGIRADEIMVKALTELLEEWRGER